MASLKTMSVPDAGRIYFGIGKNAAYAAAARGEIPTIRIGARLRVPIALLDRMLDGLTAPSSGPASLGSLRVLP